MATIRNYEGQLAAKLQEYRSLGQKEARKQRPPQDAATPDQHEAALKSEAEGHLNAEQNLFDTALTEASREAVQARQKALQHQLAIEQMVSDTAIVEAVEAELSGDRPGLVRATEARMRTEAEIRYFRAANDIHEEADYPESRLWHVGVIAVLALVEMVANAFFFENNQGLLGGFFVALGIAAVNMGSALLLGMGFTFKNLSAPEKRLGGWLCLVGFVVLTIFCNALFASFRSEYQLVVDPTDAAQVNDAFLRAWPEAVAVFRADMTLKDQTSFILFIFGIVLSVMAFWKGYTFDDKYPGYGSKDRKFKAAQEQELLLQESVRKKIKDLLHKRKAAVHAALQEPSTQVGMLARRIADLEHARIQLQTQSEAVTREYVMVVEAYRHANLGVRVVPPPQYFSESPELSLRTDARGADRVIEELASVQAEVKDIASATKDVLNERLRELERHTSEVLKRTVTTFMTEVQKEAEESLAAGVQVMKRMKAA